MNLAALIKERGKAMVKFYVLSIPATAEDVHELFQKISGGQWDRQNKAEKEIADALAESLNAAQTHEQDDYNDIVAHSERQIKNASSETVAAFMRVCLLLFRAARNATDNKILFRIDQDTQTFQILP